MSARPPAPQRQLQALKTLAFTTAAMASTCPAFRQMARLTGCRERCPPGTIGMYMLEGRLDDLVEVIMSDIGVEDTPRPG